MRDFQIIGSDLKLVSNETLENCKTNGWKIQKLWFLSIFRKLKFFMRKKRVVFAPRDRNRYYQETTIEYQAVLLGGAFYVSNGKMHRIAVRPWILHETCSTMVVRSIDLMRAVKSRVYKLVSLKTTWVSSGVETKCDSLH